MADEEKPMEAAGDEKKKDPGTEKTVAEEPEGATQEPPVSPQGVVEAALFSAGRALEVDEIVEATGLGKREVRQSLKNLIKIYRERETSIQVAKVGEKYAMALTADYADHARKLAEMEVPIKTLKTAALIAFHQPIKQSDLQNMIGSKVYDHVGELVELGLVKAREHDRTKLLTTTERFAEYFGIDSIEPAEIKKWLADKTGIKLEKVGETLDDYSANGGGEADGSGTTDDESDDGDAATADDGPGNNSE